MSSIFPLYFLDNSVNSKKLSGIKKLKIAFFIRCLLNTNVLTNAHHTSQGKIF